MPGRDTAGWARAVEGAIRERVNFVVGPAEPAAVSIDLRGDVECIADAFSFAYLYHADLVACLRVFRPPVLRIQEFSSQRVTAIPGVGFVRAARFGLEERLEASMAARRGADAFRVDFLARLADAGVRAVQDALRREGIETADRGRGNFEVFVGRVDGPFDPYYAQAARGGQRLARSLALLLRHLTEEQRRDFGRLGSFRVLGGSSGRPYLIHVMRDGRPAGASFNVQVSGSQVKLCAHPEWMTSEVIGDVALAQKLALENDEAGFLMEANCSSHLPIWRVFPWAREVIAARVGSVGSALDRLEEEQRAIGRAWLNGQLREDRVLTLEMLDQAVEIAARGAGE